MLIHGIKIDSFTEQALDALFWSCVSDYDTGMNFDEYSFNDLNELNLKQFKSQCERFQEENESDLEMFDDNQGHNFTLSRNGHGSGYFDEYLNYKDRLKEREEAGDRLQDKARQYGECFLQLGEDGRVYIIL